MRIAVGTRNKGKLEAVKQAAAFVDRLEDSEITGYTIESGVSDQPYGLEETFAGALTRANQTLLQSDVSLAVGLEGGVYELGGRLLDIGIVCVVGRTGVRGMATSSGLALPASVASDIRSGIELSDALETRYGVNTIASRDCSGFLTDGYFTVVEYYKQPTILALKDYLNQVAED